MAFDALSGSQSLPAPRLFDASWTVWLAQGGDLALPAIVQEGDVLVVSNVYATDWTTIVPVPTVEGQGSFRYQAAFVGTPDGQRLPLPTLEGSYLPGRAFTAGDMALPLPEQADGQGWTNGDNTLPGIELSGTLAVGRILSDGVNVLPVPTVEAQAGGAAILTSGEMALPLPLVAGTLDKGTVAEGAAMLPLPTVEGVMLSGTVAVSGDLALPAPTVSGAMYAIVVFEPGDLTLPAIVQTDGQMLPPVRAPPADPSEAMALVMNARTGALSRYDAFAFDSFALVGGVAYAAGAGGLYRLDGADDAGEPIAARITQPPTDFGLAQLKRMTEVFVTYRSAGPLELSTTLDDTVTYCYRMDETKPAGLYRNRCKMGRGAKAATWQIDIQNVDGADFTLQSLEPIYEALSRRLS